MTQGAPLHGWVASLLPGRTYGAVIFATPMIFRRCVPASPRPPNRPDDEPRSYIGCGMSVRAPLSSRFRGPFSIMRRRSTSRRGCDCVPIPLDSDYPGPALAVIILGVRVLNVGQQLLGCIE